MGSSNLPDFEIGVLISELCRRPDDPLLNANRVQTCARGGQMEKKAAMARLQLLCGWTGVLRIHGSTGDCGFMGGQVHCGVRGGQGNYLYENGHRNGNSRRKVHNSNSTHKACN